MSKHKVISVILVIAILVSGCGSLPVSTPTAPPRATPTIEVKLPPLPVPVPMPAGTIEEAAVKLAELVRQEGDDGLAAMETALAAAGFPVQNDQGQLLQVAGYEDAGVIIPDWQVRAIALSAQSNGRMLLTDLAYILSSTDELSGKQDQVAQLLLAGIRDGFSSDSPPSTRFWSALIIELGRQQPESADWLTETDPYNINLDGLQVQLIVLRFLNEMALSAQAIPTTPTPASSLPMPRPFQFAWSVPIYSAFKQSADHPCTFTGTEQKIIKTGEETMKAVFRDLIKLSGIGKSFLDYTGLYNGIIVWLNMYIIYATIRIDAEMDEASRPLIRTKHERPQSGELRMITVTVNRIMDDDDQWINCLGLVLASKGISGLKIPKNGPIQGAGTEWKGIKGFNPYPNLSDRIVYFVSDKNITNLIVNDSGQAIVGVTGFGQKVELPEKSPPLKKEFTILVTVRLKQADLWGDVVDAITTARSGLGFGTSKFLAEMIQRTTLIAPSIKKTFPVTDWAADFEVNQVVGSIYARFPDNSMFGHTDLWEIYTGLQGKKCGEAGGEWVLDVYAPIPEDGIITEGKYSIQIDPKTLAGLWTGTMRQTFNFGDTTIQNIELGGTAKFVPGDPSYLELLVVKLKSVIEQFGDGYYWTATSTASRNVGTTIILETSGIFPCTK